MQVKPFCRTNTRHGKEIDQGKVDELEEKLKHKLEGYERLLAKQQWVGGDRPTLVDLFHIPFPNVLLSVSDKQVTELTIDWSVQSVGRWVVSTSGGVVESIDRVGRLERVYRDQEGVCRYSGTVVDEM